MCACFYSLIILHTATNFGFVVLVWHLWSENITQPNSCISRFLVRSHLWLKIEQGEKHPHLTLINKQISIIWALIVAMEFSPFRKWLLSVCSMCVSPLCTKTSKKPQRCQVTSVKWGWERKPPRHAAGGLADWKQGGHLGALKLIRCADMSEQNFRLLCASAILYSACALWDVCMHVFWLNVG